MPWRKPRLLSVGCHACAPTAAAGGWHLPLFHLRNCTPGASPWLNHADPYRQGSLGNVVSRLLAPEVQGPFTKAGMKL